MKKIFFLPIALLFPVLLIIKNRQTKQEIELGPASLNSSNVIVYAAAINTSKKIWKLHKKHWPIYILSTTKNWAKITDAYNSTGWIKKKHISNEKFALVLQDTYVFKNNFEEEATFLLKKNCIVKFIGKVVDKKNNKKNFCKISLDKKEYITNCQNLWLTPESNIN